MRFLLLLLLISMASLAFAQPQQRSYTTKKTAKGKAKKYYDQGMQYNQKGDNQKGIKAFEKALKEKPDFIDAQIQWAALHYDSKRYADAEIGFEKVLDIDPAYQKKVLYVLGLTEVKLNKLDEAVEHLDQYLSSGAKNKVLLKKARKKVETLRFAAVAMKNPVPFQPESLGAQVNTANPEYLPSFTADEETLVYTMRVRGQEDFYMSKKIDGVWQAGQPLEGINTPLNEGAQSISVDGRLLVFTICDRRKDGFGNCDLYFSEVYKDSWTVPANMGRPINTRAWDSQPSLSADGKALYFSSSREGGKGGLDLWVSYQQEDGRWGRPENLSELINTKADEQSPFIHADGQTLYFMSNGHPGMGGFDLFYSRRQEDGSWGKPQNLGYPINTEADESTLVISLDGQTAYFASDRDILPPGEEKTDQEKVQGMDLYSFPLYKEAQPQPVTYVKAKIYDAQNKQALSAKVEFVDLATGKLHAFSTTGVDGAFLICLPMGKNYALNVSKEKYLFHSEHFALSDVRTLEEPFELQIGLQSIPETPIASAEAPGSPAPADTKPIILHNVFFDTGSAELRAESFIELNRLKQLLEDNPQMNIQINGHTDNVGTEEDNLVLSENRAKAVLNYLVEKGIVASRLSHKGFGESRPIEANDTAEGRQTNRRTAFVVK
ncbi:MAG: OmpA family protein [Bacteroidota bacterium]